MVVFAHRSLISRMQTRDRPAVYSPQMADGFVFVLTGGLQRRCQLHRIRRLRIAFRRGSKMSHCLVIVLAGEFAQAQVVFRLGGHEFLALRPLGIGDLRIGLASRLDVFNGGVQLLLRFAQLLFLVEVVFVRVLGEQFAHHQSSLNVLRVDLQNLFGIDFGLDPIVLLLVSRPFQIGGDFFKVAVGILACQGVGGGNYAVPVLRLLGVKQSHHGFLFAFGFRHGAFGSTLGRGAAGLLCHEWRHSRFGSTARQHAGENRSFHI